MTRSATRFCLFLLNAALLTGFFLPAARADGPALSAVFGIAGHYRPGGWCPVMVTVRNPGADTISGQLQVLTSGEASQPAYGRPRRTDTPSVVFACPVSVSGGSSRPQTFPIYLRGIDPGTADLTVQLVEGHERGNGRVLAQINNQNPNETSVFTGNPIGANDQFLIGFGGDPSAFMFLNGRHVGAANTAVANALNPRFNQGQNTGMPATIQIAEPAAASDLPDKAAGYDGVDSFLLRSDAPVEGLTEAQIDALKGWVMGGGHLVICGGTDPTRFQSAFFEGLLPAAVGSGTTVLTVPGAGTAGALTMTPKPLPGVRVLQSTSDQRPLLISGPYGAGSVTLTAYDPTGSASQAANTFALPAVWRTIFAGRRDQTSSVLGMTAAREENSGAAYYGGAYYGGGPSLLSEAVMRGPSLDAPGTAVIGLFLLIYLVVLVPVNYLVLKRLDRKEWAWGTIPALVLVFAAGTFAVGYAAKGGSVFVNRAALIETSVGRREAGVYAELGLFSPHRTSYDIALPGANMTAAVPNPGIGYGSRGGDSQASGPAQFVQTPAGVTLPDTPVNMWAMRAFDTQSTVDLGGAIAGSLAVKNGVMTGSFTNQTAFTLTDCAVWFMGRWLSIGTLAPGAALSAPLDGPGTAPQATLPLLTHPNFSGAQSDIHDRMHAALADYYRSLGQATPNFSGGYPSPSYTPAPGEALLVGWSSDPKLAGPAPQIDGHSVTENDVSLVIVHVPVAAK